MSWRNRFDPGEAGGFRPSTYEERQAYLRQLRGEYVDPVTGQTTYRTEYVNQYLEDQARREEEARKPMIYRDEEGRLQPGGYREINMAAAALAGAVEAVFGGDLSKEVLSRVGSSLALAQGGASLPDDARQGLREEAMPGEPLPPYNFGPRARDVYGRLTGDTGTGFLEHPGVNYGNTAESMGLPREFGLAMEVAEPGLGEIWDLLRAAFRLGGNVAPVLAALPTVSSRRMLDEYNVNPRPDNVPVPREEANFIDPSTEVYEGPIFTFDEADPRRRNRVPIILDETIPIGLRDNQAFLERLFEVDARAKAGERVGEWLRPEAPDVWSGNTPVGNFRAREAPGNTAIPISAPDVPNFPSRPRFHEVGRNPTALDRNYQEWIDKILERWDGGNPNATPEERLKNATNYMRDILLRTVDPDIGEVGSFNWYPQQRMLDRIIEAVGGNEVVGRAAFEHLNNYQATFSARSNPHDQAGRASVDFINEALGVNAAAQLDYPTGLGGVASRQQANSAGAADVRNDFFDWMTTPKTGSFVGNLSGNMNLLTADIHYARTLWGGSRQIGTDARGRAIFEDHLELGTKENPLNAGGYVALRDFGVHVMERLNADEDFVKRFGGRIQSPAELQQRLWIGNAINTGLGGRSIQTRYEALRNISPTDWANLPPEMKQMYGDALREFSSNFDDTANSNIDEMLTYIRARSNDPEIEQMDDTSLLRTILDGDPRLNQYLEGYTNYRVPEKPEEMESLNPLFGDGDPVSREIDIRSARPSQMRAGLIQAAENVGRTVREGVARLGRNTGLEYLVRSITDPELGFRTLQGRDKMNQIRELVSSLERSGGLTPEDAEIATGILSRLKEPQFNSFANAYLAIERNFPVLYESFRSGGFTAEFDSGTVPLLRAFGNSPEDFNSAQRARIYSTIDGYAAGAYPMLARSFRVADPSIVTEEELKGYLTRFILENAPFIAKSRHGLGGWFDTNTGLLHFDVIVATNDKDRAIDIARAANQIAITNFAGPVGDASDSAAGAMRVDQDVIFLPTEGSGQWPIPSNRRPDPNNPSDESWRYATGITSTRVQSPTRPFSVPDIGATSEAMRLFAREDVPLGTPRRPTQWRGMQLRNDFLSKIAVDSQGNPIMITDGKGNQRQLTAAEFNPDTDLAYAPNLGIAERYFREVINPILQYPPQPIGSSKKPSTGFISSMSFPLEFEPR